MAPVNKATKQKLSYENAYPLKPIKTIIHHQRNIFEKTLHLLKETFLSKQNLLKICNFTAHTINYFAAERCSSAELDSIRKQLQERIVKDKRMISKREPNCFISSPKKNSAQDFAGLLWSWKVNSAAKKAGKRMQFLQKCIWLTLETMTDIDVHILAKLLIKHPSLFPCLHEHIINYKETVHYLQKEIFSRKGVLPKVIQALNHWFTVMPLLDEIRHYTGWLFLLNIKAYLLDADSLYEILIKTESMQTQNGSKETNSVI